MGHSPDTYKPLEISSDELRAVVGNDTWEYRRELLPGTLNDGLYIRLANALTDPCLK